MSEQQHQHKPGFLQVNSEETSLWFCTNLQLLITTNKQPSMLKSIRLDIDGSIKTVCFDEPSSGFMFLSSVTEESNLMSQR